MGTRLDVECVCMHYVYAYVCVRVTARLVMCSDERESNEGSYIFTHSII